MARCLSLSFTELSQIWSENFHIELLRNDAAKYSQLAVRETDAIKTYNSIKKGYNTSLGGSIGTSKPIKIRDLEFNSRSAAAEFFGVEYNVFNFRLGKLGWTPEEAAGLVSRTYLYSAPFEAAGKIYSSLFAACKELNVSYKTAYARKVRGWSNEQVLELHDPPKPYKIPTRVNGQSYSSLREACNKLGLGYGKVYARLKRGWSLEEAFDVKYRK